MAKIALLIGVSEYESSFQSLPSAIKDVEAMARVLKHSEIGGFDEVNVLKNPKRQEIEEAIYELFAGRTQDDLTLFYFSGHGIKDMNGQLFLTTPSTRKDDKELIVPPTAVAANYLQEQMTNSRSRREVIILDCCFSGAFVQGMKAKGELLNIQNDLGGQGRAILTSSSLTQYSFANEETELSIYTRFLVEGIETGAADLDGDGWISVNELHEYASSKVKETSPAMTPKFYPVEEGYKIYLAQAPIDDPKLKYRKKAQEYVTKEGEFISIGYRILNRMRIELRLTTEEAKLIEAEVQRPYQEYQQKLREYEEAFQE